MLLDADLAALYGVTTGALNQAVRRNGDRFPADFMFRLDAQERVALRSQIVTSNAIQHDRRARSAPLGSGVARAIPLMPSPSRASPCFPASCAQSGRST
ncbi:MAG TPA: ORF6N domain-containing protein [Burkholderiales bacterium]|nr:ORF6N domain-containing protein [Burkholderiales bacterium]